MRKLRVAEDIIPIAEFKTHASAYFRRLHRTRRPMVITQNGKPAAVVLSPEEFDELGYREYVKAKVQAGIESAEREGTHSLDDALEQVLAKIGERPGRAR